MAILAVVSYYRPWEKLDSIHFLGKKYPPPAKVSSGAAPPDTKSASVEKEAVADQPPEPISPPQPPQEDVTRSPGDSSTPPDSSNPSGPEEKSSVLSSIPPKEMQTIKAQEGEKPGKEEIIAEETLPPKKMETPQKKVSFAIKIMALRDPQKAQEFMESQKKRGLDIHIRTVTIKDQGLFHQIFWGHFGSQEEARGFLEEKEIRKSYPGSVIMKLTR
jgi:cell division septation protein DedD